MEGLAYVFVGKGWSIARGVPDDLEWWCGALNGWVSPYSDMWHLYRSCWNEVYPTMAAARRFAKGKGWDVKP